MCKNNYPKKRYAAKRMYVPSRSAWHYLCCKVTHYWPSDVGGRVYPRIACTVRAVESFNGLRWVVFNIVQLWRLCHQGVFKLWSTYLCILFSDYQYQKEAINISRCLQKSLRYTPRNPVYIYFLWHNSTAIQKPKPNKLNSTPYRTFPLCKDTNWLTIGHCMLPASFFLVRRHARTRACLSPLHPPPHPHEHKYAHTHKHTHSSPPPLPFSLYISRFPLSPSLFMQTTDVLPK